MKLKLLIVAAAAILLTSSCSNVFTPALYHQDIAYQPKPTSFDKSKSAVYVSAGLNNNTSLDADFLTSGQVNISGGHIFDNYNIAYGAFGVVGNYARDSTNTYLPQTFTPAFNLGSKFFGAVGGRFSANAFITYDNIEFRYIGIEAAYSHEFGAYANYRQQLFSQSGYTAVDPRTDLYTIGLTSEVVFRSKSNPDVKRGLRGFIGFTVNNSDQNNFYNRNELGEYFHYTFFPKVSYFVTSKRYFATAEVGNTLFLRIGYQF